MFHLHRSKLFDRFDDNSHGVIYLKGGSTSHWYDTDTEIDFQQESNFFYLTGIEEPDFGLLLDLESRRYVLVIPRRDATYATWYGRVYSPEHYQKESQADEVIYDDEASDWLKKRRPSMVFAYDNKQAQALETSFPLNTDSLRDALIDCRVIKTEFEIDLMRQAGEIASHAHKAVMSVLQAGANEAELRAEFLYFCHMAGQRHEPYLGIHAAGSDSAILHYVKNNKTLHDGDLYLLDAGANYRNYAADITRTFPVNGIFSPEQRLFYQICLDAQLCVMEQTKAGVKMEDLHLLAAETIVSGMADADFLRGSLSDLMENNIFALFFPHGLGHFLGLDTHDVGGYPKGVQHIDRPGLKYLRARRKLESGMVITVEPGLYFIPALLESAFEDSKKKPFLNVAALKQLLGFGGIRIEDNLVISDEGYENLTDVPKTITEIETFMRG